MVPVEHHMSRYRTAVRQTVARRRAALAALALMPGVACSAYDDAEVFRTATTVPVDSTDASADPASSEAITEATTGSTSPTPAPSIETTAPADATVPTTDAVAESTTTTASSTTVSSTTVSNTTVSNTTATAASAFAAGAELAVSFTFTPTDGGRRIENPFIAVWVEDTEGNLVRTISLWYEQTEEGPEWLSHLSRWTSATNTAIDTTTSGATRVPGDYTVAWNGVADDGSVIADGEYVLFVEAARRGGAYEITTTPINVAGGGFSVQLPDSGELTAVSAELVV